MDKNNIVGFTHFTQSDLQNSNMFNFKHLTSKTSAGLQKVGQDIWEWLGVTKKTKQKDDEQSLQNNVNI